MLPRDAIADADCAPPRSHALTRLAVVRFAEVTSTADWNRVELIQRLPRVAVRAVKLPIHDATGAAIMAVDEIGMLALDPAERPLRPFPRRSCLPTPTFAETFSCCIHTLKRTILGYRILFPL